MATIFNRPNGKWQATVRKDGQSGSRSFLKRADGAKWALETELSAGRGLLAPTLGSSASEMTLGEVLRKYRENFTSEKRCADNESCAMNGFPGGDVCRTKGAQTETYQKPSRDRGAGGTRQPKHDHDEKVRWAHVVHVRTPVAEIRRASEALYVRTALKFEWARILNPFGIHAARRELFEQFYLPAGSKEGTAAHRFFQSTHVIKLHHTKDHSEIR